MLELNKIYNMDVREGLKLLDDESIDCCISSPPYWSLRDYGIIGLIWDGDPECDHIWTDHLSFNWLKEPPFCVKCGAWYGVLGLEPNFEMFIKHLCDIYDGVYRVLKKTGTCWVNLGDTYGGSGVQTKWNCKESAKTPTKKYKQNYASKCLFMIPQRFAIEMINRGWILRNVIIWHKPNPMPSSAKDRFTVDFEYVYFFVKNKKYWFEQQREGLSQLPATVNRKKYKTCPDANFKNTGEQSKPSKAFSQYHVRDLPQKSKYKSLEIETKHIQGMNKQRGEGLIEKRNLPRQEEVVAYLKKWKNKTYKELDTLLEKKGDTASHWFTKPESSHGFAYPSPEDWLKLKEIFGFDDFFDKEMTEIYYETDAIGKNILSGYTEEDLATLEIEKSTQNRYKYAFGGNSDKSTERDEKGYNNRVGTADFSPSGKNKRTVWKIPTKANPEAHFATFPPKLVQPMIKSGCPEFVCKKCGKPREKIYDVSYLNITQLPKNHSQYRPNEPNYYSQSKKYSDDKPKGVRTNTKKYKQLKNLGYSDCGCNAGFTPGVVFDPFSGTGTTLKEAWKLGRNYIGFELSEDYCEIANRNLKSTKNKRLDQYL
jgi:DNA modification methylase